MLKRIASTLLNTDLYCISIVPTHNIAYDQTPYSPQFNIVDADKLRLKSRDQY